MDTFKERVYELRKAAGMSQGELAKKACVSEGYVGQWEIGIRTPGIEIMKIVANIFDVSLDYLNGLSDKRK